MMVSLKSKTSLDANRPILKKILMSVIISLKYLYLYIYIYKYIFF
jgi:hypothetical protein